MGRIFIHDLEVIFILSCKGQKISKANQLGVGGHLYGTEHEREHPFKTSANYPPTIALLVYRASK